MKHFVTVYTFKILTCIAYRLTLLVYFLFRPALQPYYRPVHRQLSPPLHLGVILHCVQQ